MKQVQDIVTKLTGKLLEAKVLTQIALNNPDSKVEWHLIQNTAYNIGRATGKGKGLNKLCCTVVNETSKCVFDSRTKLLQLTSAMNLQMSLWLEVNQWLVWNLNGLTSGKRFEYWDRVPDQKPLMPIFYSGQKAKKIHQLL